MKIYYIMSDVQPGSDEARELERNGAYYDRAENKYCYSEYTPEREFFEHSSWSFKCVDVRSNIRLVDLAKALVLDYQAVCAFLFQQNMLGTDGDRCILTRRAKKFGAGFKEDVLSNKNYPIYIRAEYMVCNDKWAAYLNRYRDKIEQISGKKEPVQAQGSDKEAWKNFDRERGGFPKIGIPAGAVFLDTETTGVSAKDEVVDLGIIDADGNVLYNGLFRPYCKNSPRAKAVNHLSEKTLEHAPDFAEEFDEIRRILKGKVIVGHNIAFDIRMLRQTAKIHRCSKSFLDDAETIDTIQIAKRFLKVQAYGLETLCKILGKEGAEEHRAFGDAKWTLWLAEAFEQRPFQEIKGGR